MCVLSEAQHCLMTFIFWCSATTVSQYVIVMVGYGYHGCDSYDMMVIVMEGLEGTL